MDDSISIRDCNGGHVAHLTRGYEGDDHGDGCPSYENARLIAAAPMLLDAPPAPENFMTLPPARLLDFALAYRKWWDAVQDSLKPKGATR